MFIYCMTYESRQSRSQSTCSSRTSQTRCSWSKSQKQKSSKKTQTKRKKSLQRQRSRKIESTAYQLMKRRKRSKSRKTQTEQRQKTSSTQQSIARASRLERLWLKNRSDEKTKAQRRQHQFKLIVDLLTSHSNRRRRCSLIMMSERQEFFQICTSHELVDESHKQRRCMRSIKWDLLELNLTSAVTLHLLWQLAQTLQRWSRSLTISWRESKHIDDNDAKMKRRRNARVAKSEYLYWFH